MKDDKTEKAEMYGLIAQVAVEKALYSFDSLFDYIVPYDLADKAFTGKRVIVPFGRTAKRRVGIILSLREDVYELSKFKKVIRIIDSEPLIGGEILNIIHWLKENTFCTYFDAVKTVIPTGFGLVLTEQYRVNEKTDVNHLTDKEKQLYQTLKPLEQGHEIDNCIKNIEINEKELFNSLLQKGIIERIHSTRQKVNDDTVKILSLSPEYDPIYTSLTPKQRLVIDMLSEYETACAKEICYVCNVSSVVVSNLIKKGVLEERIDERSRAISKDFSATKSLSDIVFSPAQQKIFDGLKELSDLNEAKCALLRGVTGSGKTSIFIKLIEHTLNKGKTAILLVPEISLTPQMTNNFICLFGNKVAIIHSNLSLGQRADEYKRIKNGEAQIIIGTRSAVFAPLENIGIIVIDEEGEHTYKSDRSPRYHARNVAKQRAFYHNAFLLLASATPSIESYHFAKTGRYSLFELEERYSNALLPDVYIVDMKIEAEKHNRSNFSEVLLEEIAENLRRGEQTLILLNRRGYHTYARCVSCGSAINCPVCLIALTYHKPNNTVQCHYCGYRSTMPERCPECNGKHIYQTGTGTQRVEDELSEYFPGVRILRMDADTTVSKTAFETKFSEFRNGDYDIMIGTQMIAKGLDFENITLVGVLMIDKSLYAGDYLGYEKTFSLVTQVVGRSGRGSKKGRAYLQTYTPDHYVLNLAAAQNYAEFYEQEAEVRKALIFPPFCDIFMICFSAIDENVSHKAAKKFIELLREELKNVNNNFPYRVLGPTKSGTGRTGGKYRHKLIIKCKNSAAFREIIAAALKSAYSCAEFKDVGLYVDINGEII